MTHFRSLTCVAFRGNLFYPDAKPTVYYPGIRLDARHRFSLCSKTIRKDLVVQPRIKFPYGFSVDGFGAEPECVTSLRLSRTRVFARLMTVDINFPTLSGKQSAEKFGGILIPSR